MQRQVLGLILTFVTGCAATPSMPLYLEPAKTVVLPVVDLRQDGPHAPEMALILDHAYIAGLLKKRGYQVVFVSDATLVETMDITAFASAEPSRLRALGPRDARWLILVALYDVGPTRSLLSAAAATCAGRLFDKAKQQVVWQRQLSYRELAGSDIQSGPWRRAVAQGCFRHLLKTLPDRRSRF